MPDEEPKPKRGRPKNAPDHGLSPLDDMPQFEFVPRDVEAEIQATKDKALKARKPNTPLKGA